MSTKQKLKHFADRAAKEIADDAPTSSADAEPTPDGLGTWEGGTVALKGAANWVSLKSHPTRTVSNKNAHGTNAHLGPKPITHRQDQDFNEIHTDADGEFFLYNVENDKWDIPTDAQTIPFYEDENGKTWAFNWKTGAWDVAVIAEDQDAPEPVVEQGVYSDVPNDSHDECLVCGTEVPPGPDFCSATCEELARSKAVVAEHGDAIAEAVSDNTPTA